MDITPFLQWAHDTWIGGLVRELSWLYTVGLIIHFTGLCLLIGAMLLVDLRLMGFARQIPLRSALAFLPFAIVGFGLNLLTGAMFFAFDPFAYWANPAFKVKMVLVLIAGLNALWFTVVEQKKLAALPEGAGVDLPTRISAGLSIGLWLLVILFGRLIVAFQGSTSFF